MCYESNFIDSKKKDDSKGLFANYLEEKGYHFIIYHARNTSPEWCC
jgi:hypothetical protein